MNLTMPVPDPCRCPLCGQANACVMAKPASTTADTSSGPCWCTLVQFGADLLNQLPEATRNKACICKACVAASKITSQDPSEGEGS